MMYKNSIHYLLVFVFFSGVAFGQDTSDANRLRGMEYMKHANNVDCQDENASFLEQRICLNLEFQRLDSTMNAMIYELLCVTKSKEDIYYFRKEQAEWIFHRRKQSELVSEGYNGHHVGISYLSKMNEITSQRIDELNRLLAARRR